MGHIVNCQVGEETILLDMDDTSKPDEPRRRNWEAWRARTYTTKEPDTLAWIDTFFQPGDVIYDVGANIGQYALYAAKRLKGACRVLAFEPEALNYAKLNKNIVLNRLSDAITAYCVAITDRLAFDSFYVKRFSPGASLHAWERPVGQGDIPFEPQHRQGMLGLSLDDLTGQFALPFPNHIKIDVDGIEDRIVQSATQTWANPRLKTALIEIYMHKDIADQIVTILLQHNFVLHNPEAVEAAPGTAQNFIFKRPGIRD
jgi:FkbM family methyltransferase